MQLGELQEMKNLVIGIVLFVLLMVFLSIDCGMARPAYEIGDGLMVLTYRGRLTGFAWETRITNVVDIEK